MFLQLFIWPALGAYIAGKLGVRVNLTRSVPIGLYFVSSAHGATFVELCPPEPFGSLSVDRGYRRPSTVCQDGGESLVKPIIAQAGDLVEVTFDGIRVNGSAIPNTQPRTEDSLHRPLHPWPPGYYRVPAGVVWVASSYNPLGFDSRYFGPISVKDSVRHRLSPDDTIKVR
jgi:conjugative transfer signal peptidase TraF